MFLATMCPSSGENTVPMRRLVFVTLKQVDSLKLQGSMSENGVTMCPSSGENTVPMRHLVFVTLKQVDNLKLQGSMS